MMNAAATRSEKRPDAIRSGRTKVLKTGGDRDLGEARQAKKGAARERPRHQATDETRRLAVCIGLPGMKRSESHLGTEPGQRKHERCPQPQRVQTAGTGNQVRQQKRSRAAIYRLSRREQKHREQCERDSDGREHEVLPHRFERAAVVARIDQRRNGESSGFHPNPQQREVLTQRDQRRRRQEYQQATSERAPASWSLDTEVAHRVGRHDKEKHAHEAENEEAKLVDHQPAPKRGVRPTHP